MTFEDCMTIIGTHHITEENFWGTIKRCVELQTEVRPILGNKNGRDLYICPTCGYHFSYPFRHCCNCGQAMKYREVED